MNPERQRIFERAMSPMSWYVDEMYRSMKHEDDYYRLMHRDVFVDGVGADMPPTETAIEDPVPEQSETLKKATELAVTAYSK